MLDVLEKLKGARPIRAARLRSKNEARLIQAATVMSIVAFAQLIVMIVVSKLQQRNILPPVSPWITGYVWVSAVCLIAAIFLLLSLIVVGLLHVQKNAYEALMVEAEHDLAYVINNLLCFDRRDLIAARTMFESKAVEIQSRTGFFYGGGAVFLLTLASTAWNVSKDILGGDKLSVLTAGYVAQAAPVLLAMTVGMLVIIACFRPLKSVFGYRIRLIEIALMLQEKHNILSNSPAREGWWVRLRKFFL